MLKKE